MSIVAKAIQVNQPYQFLLVILAGLINPEQQAMILPLHRTGKKLNRKKLNISSGQAGCQNTGLAMVRLAKGQTITCGLL